MAAQGKQEKLILPENGGVNGQRKYQSNGENQDISNSEDNVFFHAIRAVVNNTIQKK